jgi:hypothetical protein
MCSTNLSDAAQTYLLQHKLSAAAQTYLLIYQISKSVCGSMVLTFSAAQ